MFRIRMMLIETLAISFWLFVVIRAIVNWTETYTWLGIALVFIITCAVFIVVRNVQIQLRDREKLDDLKSRIDVRIWNNYLIEKERQRIAREQNHFRIFGFGRFRSLFSFLIRREYL
jgi:signal transduction histidine kinase